MSSVGWGVMVAVGRDMGVSVGISADRGNGPVVVPPEQADKRNIRKSSTVWNFTK
jgi:hypothetical protein